MMCLDRDDLHERAAWDGAAGLSRRQLLEHLEGEPRQIETKALIADLSAAFISPQVMLPSRRLATLFDQARRHQQQSCVYHEDPDPSSLYTDHECTSGQFPSVTTHILADHTDEVWRIEWSPDGMMLASAGKDRAVVIWQLRVSLADPPVLRHSAGQGWSLTRPGDATRRWRSAVQHRATASPPRAQGASGRDRLVAGRQHSDHGSGQEPVHVGS